MNETDITMVAHFEAQRAALEEALPATAAPLAMHAREEQRLFARLGIVRRNGKLYEAASGKELVA